MTVLDRKTVPGAKTIKGDVRDAGLDLSGFGMVFHLAAVSNSRLAEADRALAWDVNVNGTRNICGKLGAGQRLIFMSTAQVYGKSEAPHKESETPLPSNYYALTKLLGEEIVRFHSGQAGFDHLVFRLFNSYSMDQEGDLLLPEIIRKYRSGGHIEMKNPDAVLDMVHADDVMAVLSDSGRIPPGTYNLCSGRAISVREVCEAVGRYLKAEKGQVLGKGERTVLRGDNSKIKGLGYSFRGFALP